MSNFDTDFTSEDPTLTPPDDSKSAYIQADECKNYLDLLMCVYTPLCE